jgi:hypothetical protein
MFLVILNNFHLGDYKFMNKAITDLNKDFNVVRKKSLISKYFFLAGKLRTCKVVVLNFQLLGLLKIISTLEFKYSDKFIDCYFELHNTYS